MNFWKTFGAAMLAVFVGFALFMGVLLIFGISLISSFEMPESRVSPQSILYIDLAEDVVDAPRISTFSSLDVETMTFMQPITILEALSAIELAAADNNIKGICIRQDGGGIISAANIEELRGALERFKLSGKFVVAYDDSYTQGEYYLASVADKVLLHPEGALDWRGIGFNISFFRGLLDKLDIEAEVFRPTTCKYKSAVEPYIMTKMSDANREQMQHLANTIWQVIVEDVAASRKVDAAMLKECATELRITLPEEALRYGMVDSLVHEDELYDVFDKYGVKRNNDGVFNKVSLGEYIAIEQSNMLHAAQQAAATRSSNTPPTIAIVYADGQIVDGNAYMDDYVFGSALAEQLRTLRNDANTRAVVVRVNSPGGSALASDIVWNEMRLLQEEKPVVVSMGDMAASGGYYISSPADYIVANRMTLTGSIGVFGIMFNLEDMLRNKLGITFDEAGTSPTATGMGSVRPLRTTEREAVTKSVDRVYSTFTQHVSNDRNLDIERVEELAEGRVWCGKDAVESGLADINGGFTEAIALAAELADLGDNFALQEVSAPLTPFEEWLMMMGPMFANQNGLDWTMVSDTLMPLLQKYPFLLTRSGIQTITPYDIKLNI